MFVCKRKSMLAAALVLSLAVAAHTQSLPKVVIVPLTVEKGFPLQVKLTEKVPFKENQTVEATVAEPVYAFDRIVIPTGTKVVGKITGFDKPGAFKRTLTMLGG